MRCCQNALQQGLAGTNVLLGTHSFRDVDPRGDQLQRSTSGIPAHDRTDIDPHDGTTAVHESLGDAGRVSLPGRQGRDGPLGQRYVVRVRHRLPGALSQLGDAVSEHVGEGLIDLNASVEPRERLCDVRALEHAPEQVLTVPKRQVGLPLLVHCRGDQQH